jgi:hypothetical protein
MKPTGRKTVKVDRTTAPMIKAAKGTMAGNSGGAAPARHAPSHAEIATRSYELYLARGGMAGHEVEDWLAAEAQLRSK